MELLESDLRSVIYGGKHIPPELCAQMMLQVSSALIYMHNLGLLHRDIKPANIFVTDLKIIRLVISARQWKIVLKLMLESLEHRSTCLLKSGMLLSLQVLCGCLSF